jgi:hypothetical protein
VLLSHLRRVADHIYGREANLSAASAPWFPDPNGGVCRQKRVKKQADPAPFICSREPIAAAQRKGGRVPSLVAQKIRSMFGGGFRRHGGRRRNSVTKSARDGPYMRTMVSNAAASPPRIRRIHSSSSGGHDTQPVRREGNGRGDLRDAGQAAAVAVSRLTQIRHASPALTSIRLPSLARGTDYRPGSVA